MLLSTWTRALIWLLQPTAPRRTPLLLAPLSEEPGRQLQLRSTVCSTWPWLLWPADPCDTSLIGSTPLQSDCRPSVLSLSLCLQRAAAYIYSQLPLGTHRSTLAQCSHLRLSFPSSTDSDFITTAWPQYKSTAKIGELVISKCSQIVNNCYCHRRRVPKYLIPLT